VATIASLALRRVARQGPAAHRQHTNVGVLVGHSYGGFVITDAAGGRSDVLALVYAAAFLPSAGDSVVSMGAGSFLHRRSPIWSSRALRERPPRTLITPCFPTNFAQDLRADDAAVLNAAQRAVNLQIVGTPSGPVATRHGLAVVRMPAALAGPSLREAKGFMTPASCCPRHTSSSQAIPPQRPNRSGNLGRSAVRHHKGLSHVRR
jgi:pimeloyl-ACP methyl ester carboxylesterase